MFASVLFLHFAFGGLEDMDVSKNSGTPKSSILIGLSSINHPFWGTLIFGNTYMDSNSPIVAAIF